MDRGWIVRARPVGRSRLIASYKAAMRISPRARRQARHREVVAIGSNLRQMTYQTQNRVHGAANTGSDGLTSRQRRRVKHKENAGRGRA